MRNAFVSEITAMGREDSRVVMLSGDIGNRLFNDFKNHCPDRFYNCGVAEANMTGLAAGLASCGFRPFTYTITPFVTTRCLEQIRVDVCYHNLPVVVCAVGAGYAYATLGATHHACEDIAFLRALPNMTVVCPGDAKEVRKAVRAVLAVNGPVYLRMGKKGEPVVHEKEFDFTIGKGIVIQEGSRICLLSTGNILPESAHAGRELEKRGISTRVVSFHTVKPLDEELLRDAFANFDLVATVEEHSRIGGLGGAVAEWAADNGPFPARLVRFGTPDLFPHEAGEQEYFRHKFGLTGPQIAEQLVAKLGGAR